MAATRTAVNLPKCPLTQWVKEMKWQGGNVTSAFEGDDGGWMGGLLWAFLSESTSMS